MPSSRVVLACALCVSVVAMIAFVDRPVRTQAATVCGCPDVFDLINRLNMDEIAIAVLSQEVPKIEAADKAAGKASSMDDVNAKGDSNYTTVKNTILEALKSRQMLGGKISQGSTSGRCGSSVVISSSPCMDEVVLFHEDNVHVPACDQDVKAGKTTAIGARAPLTTVAYVKEEIAGYRAEMDHIRQVLSALPASCRPSGWVGMIYYFEESTMNSTSTLTPGGQLVAGTEGGAYSLVREARILYRETGTPTINLRLEQNATEFSNKTARWGCTGGLRQGPLQTTTFKYEQKRKATGSKDGDIEVAFEYDAATGEYTLGFQIPALGAEGEITTTDETQNDCDPKNNGTKTSPAIKFSQAFDGDRMSVSGKATRGLDTIQGQETMPMGPSVSTPGMTMAHTASVRWVFYKVG